QTQNYEADVKSLDNIMTVLYEVISGDKGVERDWNRFNNLFTHEAKLIPSSADKDGRIKYNVLSPQDYIDSSGAWLVENGFHEKEIKREVQHFGSLIHIWSTYAAYRSKTDKDPFIRGINSIQLFFDGSRYWIKSIYWTPETPLNPIPAKYLPE
ncbi:MAG: hypothetical protein KJO29_05430, partial [Bacteroidia bacterium]|nr:hypothetical protein [Bacteroidia bacterium]